MQAAWHVAAKRNVAEFLVGKAENHVDNLGVDNTKMNIGKYCWKGWNGFLWRSVENGG